MELSKLQYDSIMDMPLKRFYDFLEWKLKFDEELNSLRNKKMEQYHKNRTK